MEGYSLLAYLKPGLSRSQLQMAALIEAAFLAEGFSRACTAAAIVNAFAESRLDPLAELKTIREDSAGLFMLNRMGGLGAGMPVGARYPAGDSRKDPELNIARVISYIKNTSSVRSALSAAGADKAKIMQVWVYQIERPADKEKEYRKRLEYQQQLFPTGINGPPVNKEVKPSDYPYLTLRDEPSTLEAWVKRGLAVAVILLAGLGTVRTVR